MFRNEKTVPNINLASSSALKAERGTAVEEDSVCESALDFMDFAGFETGCDSHSRLYIHSAISEVSFEPSLSSDFETDYDDQIYKTSRPPWQRRDSGVGAIWDQPIWRDQCS